MAQDIIVTFRLKNKYFDSRSVRFFPGTEEYEHSFKNNNLMYGLLASSIEKITGQTWEQSLQDYLFSPLEITDAETTRTFSGEPKGHIYKDPVSNPVSTEYHR